MALIFLLFMFLFLYGEVALMIEVGSRIGAIGVIGALFISAMLGFALIRRQGFQAYRRLQQSLAGGADPIEDIAHGFLILFAGLLLILPGFLTDAFGLLLLLPFVRTFLIRRGAFHRGQVFYAFSSSRPAQARSGVIEGEYKEKSEDNALGKPQKSLPGKGQPFS